MARKSRYAAPLDAVIDNNTSVFNAAGYVRSSDEDEEGISIDNQALLVRNFIEQTPDLKLQGIYMDNGATGTNFQRHGFDAMLEEIKRGNIGCIVVKDLSRFGRDYIEAGNYLETIFPRLGIRFISINDKYDSFDPRCQGDGITVALKNMINAYYAKDISTKMRVSYDARHRKGEFISAFTPFGYIRSPESKSKLIIDPEAAEIVRQIFRWRIEGALLREIADRLNQAGVPNPAHYSYLKGLRHDERFAEPIPWETSAIPQILGNIAYAGHMALGKQKNVQMNKKSRQPKENWYFTYNTHEPIVSQEDFDTVAKMTGERAKLRQEIFKKRQGPPLPENLFKGIIYCKVCGHTFSRTARLSNDRATRNIYYGCLHCRNHGLSNGKHRWIGYEDLKSVVYNIIMPYIQACVDERNLAEKRRLSDPITRMRHDKEKEIQNIKQRIVSIDSREERLLCDYYDGVLSKADYQLISAQRDTERLELAIRLEKLLHTREEYQPGFWDKNPCVNAFTQFYEARELTRDMLERLVERIDVTDSLGVEILFRFRDEFAALKNFNIGNEGVANG